MNVYIWEYESDITDRWHDGGGVVIVSSLSAEEAWKAAFPTREGGAPKPDRTLAVTGETEEEFILFPDSGCC